MPYVSPTLEGFRAAFRRPTLTLAEIAWRWTVGAVAAALFLFGFIEYLKTLSVTAVDATLLRSKHPLLVTRAISHILRGSLNRAIFAALVAALALSLLWIIAASIGRTATVRALLHHLRADFDRNPSSDGHNPDTPNPSPSSRLPTFRPLTFSPLSFCALIGLNFLRAAAALAAALALMGAAILAGFASSGANPRPVLFFVLFMPLAALTGIAWSVLNWFLSLASIFVVRDDQDALSAFSAAVTFFRERSGPVFAVSTWTGLAHLVIFSVASTVAPLLLVFMNIAPARIIVVAVVLVTLAYFAIADWLYIARLAGYVFLAEMPDALTPAPMPVVPAVTGQFASSVSTQTSI